MHTSTHTSTHTDTHTHTHTHTNTHTHTHTLSHLPIKRVQQGVTSPIGHTAAAVGLSPLAVVETLAPKCTLVDLSFLCTAEWHAVILKLARELWEG